LYWEFHEQGGKQAVRMGKWKGIRLNIKKKPEAPVELYNLETDIGEQNNVAPDHPEIVRKIERAMQRAHTPSEHWKMPGE
jgi:arylsulfatase A-like enzyme